MMESKHVFISYRQDGALNQQWAERIDARLNKQGFKVWRDVDGIQPGERWAHKIPPAIEQSFRCVTGRSHTCFFFSSPLKNMDYIS
ncbi:MAG: toll/interleukin-1 receptor domain-containing protein [Gammaproteobacteria bacterium]|nr:toll/interleukin-1 receptor domain-containing protein [Gammaproteobacteria bacterium]